MKCKDIECMLAIYDSGELSNQEQSMVEVHLATCEKCRQELESIGKVSKLVKSLDGETWWADVSSSVRDYITTSKDKVSRRKEGITSGMPTWQPARFGALLTSAMKRPVWQRAFVSVLALAIIAVTSIVIVNPWGDEDITQLALDTANSSPQVKVLLGEEIPETMVEHSNGIAQVKLATMEVVVKATVDTENLNVVAIQRQSLIFQPPGLPADRPALTQEEKVKALTIAENDTNVGVFLSHGFNLGEPDSTHHVLGNDPRRVAWLALEGVVSDYYSGIIVNLDNNQDVTVIWGGELPDWWPFT